MCQHEYKVNETKTRSLTKTITTRVLEITIDTAILLKVGLPIFESFGLAVSIEFICLSVCYVLERIWNKIQWGRKILRS